VNKELKRKTRRVMERVNSIAGRVDADLRVASIEVAKEDNVFVAYVRFGMSGEQYAAMPIILGETIGPEQLRRMERALLLFVLAQREGIDQYIMGHELMRVIGGAALNEAPHVIRPILGLLLVTTNKDERTSVAMSMCAAIYAATEQAEDFLKTIATADEEDE